MFMIVLWDWGGMVLVFAPGQRSYLWMKVLPMFSFCTPYSSHSLKVMSDKLPVGVNVPVCVYPLLA